MDYETCYVHIELRVCFLKTIQTFDDHTIIAPSNATIFMN